MSSLLQTVRTYSDPFIVKERCTNISFKLQASGDDARLSSIKPPSPLLPPLRSFFLPSVPSLSSSVLGALAVLAKLFDRGEMTDKRKAEADDISGRAERTETTAGEAQTATGDDTAGTSQAPASPAVGGLPDLSSAACLLNNPAPYWDFCSSPVGRDFPVLPQMRPLAGRRIIPADASNLYRGVGAENVNAPFTYNTGSETRVVYDIAGSSEPQTAMFLPLLENPGGSSSSVPVSGMNQTGTVQPQPQGHSIQLDLSLGQPSSAVPEQQSSSQHTGGPTCEVCGHVAGSNHVCSACHTRGPPPPPGGLS